MIFAGLNLLIHRKKINKGLRNDGIAFLISGLISLIIASVGMVLSSSTAKEMVEQSNSEKIVVDLAEYIKSPKESWDDIVRHMNDIYPIATDAQIKKILK